MGHLMLTHRLSQFKVQTFQSRNSRFTVCLYHQHIHNRHQSRYYRLLRSTLHTSASSRLPKFPASPSIFSHSGSASWTGRSMVDAAARNKPFSDALEFHRLSSFSALSAIRSIAFFCKLYMKGNCPTQGCAGRYYPSWEEQV
jgi:hypothetical protein